MTDIDIAVDLVPKTLDITVEMTGGGGGRVDAVVAGSGVTVDSSDPARPIVSASDSGGDVASVNGQTGVVVLAAADVGADPAGTAQGLVDQVTPASIGAATSAQGALADTAVQPGSLGTASTKDVPASGVNATSAQAVMGDDTRLTNARTPTTHAASHASAGADPITPASIGAATAADITAAVDTVSLGARSVSGATTIAVTPVVQELTLTGATTITLATPTAASKATLLTLSLIQDGTGGKTVTWPAGLKWPGGTAPTLPTTANAESVVTLLWSSARGWRGFVSGLGMA